MLALFPICLAIGNRPLGIARVAAFQIFSTVAVVEHSYWASLFTQSMAPEFHAALLARDHTAEVFLVLQLALLAGYTWLLCEAILQIVWASRTGATHTASR